MAIQEQFILSKNPSTGTVLLPQVSNNTAFEIDNDGTGHGVHIHQDGVLASGKYGLYVYSNAVQVNSSLAYFNQDNASSTVNVVEINNDGTGEGLYISQNGVLADTKNVLHVKSLVANAIGSDVVRFNASHSSNAGRVVYIVNAGVGHGLQINQDGVTATNYYTLYIESDSVAQTNSSLVLFKMGHASSTTPVLEIDNNGTGHALYIHQDGNLASGKYALYIDNNGTPVDGAGRCIRLDGCTVSGTGAILGYIGVNIDGTQRAVPYYAIA